MFRRRMLAIPTLVSALSIMAAPAMPPALGGGAQVLAAQSGGDCWFKWLADASGTIYCKEAGTNCHASCPPVE